MVIALGYCLKREHDSSHPDEKDLLRRLDEIKVFQYLIRLHRSQSPGTFVQDHVPATFEHFLRALRFHTIRHNPASGRRFRGGRKDNTILPHRYSFPPPVLAQSSQSCSPRRPLPCFRGAPRRQSALLTLGSWERPTPTTL